MSEFAFKQANMQDSKLIFDWALDPSVRQNSTNTNVFTFEAHCSWLKNKLTDPNYFIWIFLKDSDPIGLVRLEKKEDTLTLSYLIEANARGRGYASIMLKLAEEKIRNDLGHIKIIAFVKKGNIGSQKILLNLNFKDVANNFESQLLHFEKWI